MTAQEIFDTVARHLIEQGRRAIESYEGNCAYRGVGGTKCAVGVLIPDDQYTPQIEGASVAFVNLGRDAGAKLAPARAALKQVLTDLGLLPDHTALLIDLQRAHDNAEDFSRIKAQLRAVARAHNLNEGVLQ